ncbi:MAG TPA: 3-deoxy-manno-octulosonate cytidylyltransferase [Anaeromyxobacteraceae bacterium]|nr:3-deoxy-manno-octulosonate cytidylyltransferase [Anaeromyxobacteraceae bacterium]
MGRVAVIIPARYGATRFPGKPLALLAGKPIILHVVERARRARGVDEVVVATDDERILSAARAGGARALMTGPARTGSDRVAQAVRELDPRPEVVVNLQGDEPLIEPLAVEALLLAMADPAVEMATLSRPLAEGELTRPEVVKVVCDGRGDALYFSRAAIPHRRAGGASPLARAHVGVYAFRQSFLERFAGWPPGRLEEEEALEQLRVLERGHRIRVVETSYAGCGVDTPEDLERVRELLRGERER